MEGLVVRLRAPLPWRSAGRLRAGPSFSLLHGFFEDDRRWIGLKVALIGAVLLAMALLEVAW